MTFLMKKTTKLPSFLYPFFFALFPILSLWSQNVEIVPFSQVVRSLILALLFEAFILLGARLVFRNASSTALVAAVFTLLAFFYGRIYEMLQGSGMEWARHRILLPVFGILIIAWSLLVFKRLTDSEVIHSFFNVFGIALVIMPLITITAFAISHRDSSGTALPVEKAASAMAEGSRPDIYYIILDAYGRQDMLQNIYGLDNSGFISYLQEKGFYIADESRSNYRQTLLSLPSSLNMDYLPAIIPELDPSSKDRTGMTELIWHSQARAILARHGYRYVAIDNGYRSTARDADVLFSTENLVREDVYLAAKPVLELNEYEGLLIGSSIMRAWVDWQIQQGGENPLELIAIEAPYDHHRAQVLYVADTTKQAVDLPGDNFVFIHILIPHPPFVFGANGERIKHTALYSFADGPHSQGTQDDYLRNYANQLVYANQLAVEMVDYILDQSEVPPIIILQGDHGPRGFAGDGYEDTNMYESFSILNAYYFPDQNYQTLYPSISPVNSFRVILNQYQGEMFDLLPDISYYSSHQRPFDLMMVDDFQP
jgi:hypothetical protein